MIIKQKFSFFARYHEKCSFFKTKFWLFIFFLTFGTFCPVCHVLVLHVKKIWRRGKSREPSFFKTNWKHLSHPNMRQAGMNGYTRDKIFECQNPKPHRKVLSCFAISYRCQQSLIFGSNLFWELEIHLTKKFFWQKNGHFTIFYLNLSHFTKINLPHFTTFYLIWLIPKTKTGNHMHLLLIIKRCLGWGYDKP